MEEVPQPSLFQFWQANDITRFTLFLKRYFESQEAMARVHYVRVFQQLKKNVFECNRQLTLAQDRQKVVDILQFSTRGQRTVQEKEILRKFIISEISCIPSKSLSYSEMDMLCNEVDWFPTIGRAILFLQGDFGNCYYMIASGVVSLFVEPSKDKEMILGREYGKYRGHPLPANVDLHELGNNILNLGRGSGFGEYAILSTTQKLRSAAAVSTTDDSLLLILHASTYDACLRKFHFRQRALSSAVKLLQELPLFSFTNYSKISQVAYTMRNLTFSGHSVVATPKQDIKNVFLIASGQVKVYPAPVYSNHKNPELRKIERRLPVLAVSLLGRGQIIGEAEVLEKQTKFGMTYVADSCGCELFEMPLSTFQTHLSSVANTSGGYFEYIEEASKSRSDKNNHRFLRAGNVMKQMMSEHACQTSQKREQLLQVLPQVVEVPESPSKSGFRDSFTIDCTTGEFCYFPDNRMDFVTATTETTKGSHHEEFSESTNWDPRDLMGCWNEIGGDTIGTSLIFASSSVVSVPGPKLDTVNSFGIGATLNNSPFLSSSSSPRKSAGFDDDQRRKPANKMIPSSPLHSFSKSMKQSSPRRHVALLKSTTSTPNTVSNSRESTNKGVPKFTEESLNKNFVKDLKGFIASQY